jgi:hypothetical protein
MSAGTTCPVRGCDLPELHDFVRVSQDGTTILHLHDPETVPPPVVVWLGVGDLGYIIDALMDAADKRRVKGGRLHETIGDHLDDLAIRLHNAKPAGIEGRA